MACLAECHGGMSVACHERYSIVQQRVTGVRMRPSGYEAPTTACKEPLPAIVAKIEQGTLFQLCSGHKLPALLHCVIAMFVLAF